MWPALGKGDLSHKSSFVATGAKVNPSKISAKYTQTIPLGEHERAPHLWLQCDIFLEIIIATVIRILYAARAHRPDTEQSAPPIVKATAHRAELWTYV